MSIFHPNFFPKNIPIEAFIIYWYEKRISYEVNSLLKAYLFDLFLVKKVFDMIGTYELPFLELNWGISLEAIWTVLLILMSKKSTCEDWNVQVAGKLCAENELWNRLVRLILFDQGNLATSGSQK